MTQLELDFGEEFAPPEFVDMRDYVALRLKFIDAVLTIEVLKKRIEELENLVGRQ
jgi:hypothetical protein